MRIASWNVNSIRSRENHVCAWLKEHEPDVLLLQELKCQEQDFPAFTFQSLGYKTLVSGQKSYNGVAMLSKETPQAPLLALPGDEEDKEARFVEATIKGLRIGGIYLPNGNPVDGPKFPYKLAWMNRLKKHIQTHLQKESPFLYGGDFNVIPHERDVFNPKGWENDALFRPETLKIWREIMNLGLSDAYRALHGNKIAYSFWDYQAGSWQKDQGLRIDHFLLSPEVTDRLLSCEIDKAERGKEKPSDHAPIVIEIKNGD